MSNAANLPATESLGPAIQLGTKVEIFTNNPLPEYNSAGGPVFAARTHGDARADMMAVICNSGLPARFDSVNAVRSIDHPGVLRLRDSNVVFWPAANARYYALAYELPLAPRYMNSLDETRQAMSEDAANHYFVIPLIGALQEFERTGITHGGIRPTNIFWREGGATTPQIGECLSTPAGIGQPVLFETVERAMCPPLGRGTGSHVDDCYAFGVTIAFVILGHNPMAGMSDEQIMQAKIERGSFNAILGNNRIGASHVELLRGLLTDDARQRWTASDLEQWVSGRRLTPKNSEAGRRATRGFEFMGKEYWQARPLAIAFSQHVSEAIKLIDNKSLEKWLQRSLVDEQRLSDVTEAVNTLKEAGKTVHFEDQAVARVCMALDPAAPIRYRGLSVMPAGISGMLADGVVTGQNLQVLGEIISTQMVTQWVNLQQELKTELVPLAQQLERMRSVMEKTTFGSGVERVAYELNPTLPCLSPMMRGQYVTTAKQMLPALERIAAQGDRPREPMDRHIAAFLIVRDRRSEMLFDAMSSPESSPRRGLAMLSLYGEMQYRHGPDTLPALAAWLLPFLDASVKRFLNKPLQDKIRQQLKEAVSSGALGAMLKLVDDPKRVDYDEQDFATGRKMYTNMLQEIAYLEHKLQNRDKIHEEVGGPVAATIASVLSIILVAVAIMRAVIQTLS